MPFQTLRLCIPCKVIHGLSISRRFKSRNLYTLRFTARIAQKKKLYMLSRTESFSSFRYRFQIRLQASSLLEERVFPLLRYFTRFVKHLIRQVVLAEEDPQIMAAQLCLPISVWINLCDREPEREAEVMVLVEKHIRQFFRVNKRSGR